MAMKKICAAALLATSLTAHAGVILGGSALLDSTGLAQLETWLGQGELTLTNIFTKTPGSFGFDFHAAADGKDATFSVMSVLGNNGTTWKTVGGYNPLSWNSTDTIRFITDPADWTAFIFNLTDSVKKQQSNGGQTTNDPYLGPVFGTAPLGPDLAVDTYLHTVYSHGWSYGDAFNQFTGTAGSDTGRSIVDGTLNAGNMELGALEVFTIAPGGGATQVPEPATISLMGIGLLGWLARRRSCACTASRKKQIN
jgi:hypothetical protein